VVVQGLPRDWKIIHHLEDEWARKGRQLGKRFQVLLASPEDVDDSVEWAAPLMLEIYNAHRIVFERDGFFQPLYKTIEALDEGARHSHEEAGGLGGPCRCCLAVILRDLC